jgi:hypothetical protein
MGIGTNPADALGDLLGIEGVPTAQDHLKAAKHLADTLGIRHHIVSDSRLHIEVTFNAGHGAKFNFHDSTCMGID